MKRTIEAHFERAENELIPVVLATQFPVDRDGYREVLDLSSPDSVDMSRAPLPIIEAHDNSRVPVGVVENIRVIGNKLRGFVRMGSSARAKELLKDIQQRILRNVSVAYKVLDYIDEDDTRIVTRLLPYELSLVAAPADPHSQLFRSMTMSDNLEVLNSTRAERKQSRLATEAEQDRSTNILSIADSLKRMFASDENSFGAYVESESRKAISSGMDSGDFSARMMDKAPKAEPLCGRGFDQTPLSYSRDRGIHTHDEQTFSIGAAVRSMLSGEDSFEKQVSREFLAANKHLKRQMPNSIMIPMAALNKRAITKGGTGTSVIEQTLDAQSFIDLLRTRSAVLSRPITRLTGNVGDLRIPRLDTSSIAYWIGGDDSDTITESTPGLDELDLSPHTVAGLITYSLKMMQQSTPAIDAIIEMDLSQVLATEIDKQAFAGTGIGNVPLGILNTANVTKVVNATPDFAAVVQMEADLIAASADVGSMSYAVAGDLWATLKTTDVSTSTGKFVLEPGPVSSEGRMNGYDAFATNNLPAGNILFAAWRDFVVAEWGVLELAANPYTRFEYASTQIRGLWSVDFALRHAKSFSVITPA